MQPFLHDYVAGFKIRSENLPRKMKNLQKTSISNKTDVHLEYETSILRRIWNTKSLEECELENLPKSIKPDPEK